MRRLLTLIAITALVVGCESRSLDKPETVLPGTWVQTQGSVDDEVDMVDELIDGKEKEIEVVDEELEKLDETSESFDFSDEARAEMRERRSRFQGEREEMEEELQRLEGMKQRDARRYEFERKNEGAWKVTMTKPNGTILNRTYEQTAANPEERWITLKRDGDGVSNRLRFEYETTDTAVITSGLSIGSGSPVELRIVVQRE
jgi:hypothetical protein